MALLGISWDNLKETGIILKLAQSLVQCLMLDIGYMFFSQHGHRFPKVNILRGSERGGRRWGRGERPREVERQRGRERGEIEEERERERKRGAWGAQRKRENLLQPLLRLSWYSFQKTHSRSESYIKGL